METNENGEASESDQSTANENIGFKRVQIQKKGKIIKISILISIM